MSNDTDDEVLTAAESLMVIARRLQAENAEHERCRRDMTARTLQLEAENRELRERLREHYYDAE